MQHVAPEPLLEPDSLPVVNPLSTSPTSRWEAGAFGGYDMSYQPRDFASRMLERRKPDDGFSRQTFTLPVEAARLKAREILKQLPQRGYLTIVDHWRQQPDGQIEFSIRRLRMGE